MDVDLWIPLALLIVAIGCTVLPNFFPSWDSLIKFTAGYVLYLAFRGVVYSSWWWRMRGPIIFTITLNTYMRICQIQSPLHLFRNRQYLLDSCRKLRNEPLSTPSQCFGGYGWSDSWLADGYSYRRGSQSKSNPAADTDTRPPKCPSHFISKTPRGTKMSEVAEPSQKKNVEDPVDEDQVVVFRKSATTEKAPRGTKMSEVAEPSQKKNVEDSLVGDLEEGIN